MTTEEMAALHARVMTTPRPWTAEEFQGLLVSANVFAVGDRDGLAIGRAVFDEAELLTLAVDPGQRRKGIGRACLAAFEEVSRARGAGTAHLEVAADNAPAIALYEGSGYVRSGVRAGYYRTPDGRRIDALVYRKSLGAA